MTNLRILPLILLCFGSVCIGLALCNIGAIILKHNIEYTTPLITHDTVYVLINTDTLCDNAVRVDAVDSGSTSVFCGISRITDTIILKDTIYKDYSDTLVFHWTNKQMIDSIGFIR